MRPRNDGLCASRGRGVGFDAEQGLIGALTSVAGIVADFGTILVAEVGDHRAVEIEDKARAMVGQMDKMLQQSIVNAMKLLPQTGWGPGEGIGAASVNPESSAGRSNIGRSHWNAGTIRSRCDLSPARAGRSRPVSSAPWSIGGCDAESASAGQESRGIASFSRVRERNRSHRSVSTPYDYRRLLYFEVNSASRNS